MDFPLFLACCEQSPIAPNSAEKQEKRWTKTPNTQNNPNKKYA
jgi:hypothetical protein